MVKRNSKSMPARQRKVAPEHPGYVVADILQDIGMTARAAAQSMGVTGMALGNVLNGKSAISPDMAVRLEDFTGNDDERAEFWLLMQATHDLWHARQKLKHDIKKIVPAPREPKAA